MKIEDQIRTLKDFEVNQHKEVYFQCTYSFQG